MDEKNKDLEKIYDRTFVIIAKLNYAIYDEIKNLTIFKKGLFNSDFAEENELLNILNPVIKSESMWKPHALYLMAEYYFSKNQKQKSKEFFEQIIVLEKVSSKIKIEAQKRLQGAKKERDNLIDYLTFYNPRNKNFISV